MAFTLYIERHPDTLKIIEDFRKKKVAEGKPISQHQAVILSIHLFDNYKKLCDDKQKVIEQQEAEIKRLKAIETTAKNFKELMSKV